VVPWLVQVMPMLLSVMEKRGRYLSVHDLKP
jgi:hypothetical protein